MTEVAAQKAMKTEHPGDGFALPPMPTFAEFYLAINERDPFPWQRRLAKQVATTEQWPAEVGVPTGLGKTSCLDIAVWWLASQADRKPKKRTAPTRIWWVINRRLLVDSTAEHAETIAYALSDPDWVDLNQWSRVVIARVGHRLRSLSADPDAAPLEVIRLRGGIASRMPTDPSRPSDHALHLADVRLTAAVSRLRIDTACGRCRHGRNRQPGPAG